MSNGKHTVGKNGSAEAARIAHLERRLLISQAAEQRVQFELLKACEGAEAAECDAARTRQLQEQLQVITSHISQLMYVMYGFPGRGEVGFWTLSATGDIASLAVHTNQA